MKNFKVNECPLCGKVLRIHMVSGVTVFSCNTLVNWVAGSDDNAKQSHYVVEFDKTRGIQRMYVPPYNIDNFIDFEKSKNPNEFKSRIYRIIESSKKDEQKIKFVTETFYIRPDTETILFERVNKLMTFL